MKYSKLFLSIMALASCLASVQAGAKGGGMDGGGGDPHCVEYTNIAGKISVALVKVGQENVNKINPLVDVKSFWEVKKQLRCVPVESSDRVARSYKPTSTEQARTVLLTAEWEKLSFVAKARLTTHELAVMAGYENDGEYFVSEPIFNEIAKQIGDFQSPFGGQQIYNKDGSVTFVNPTFGGVNIQAHTFENIIGACKFAGYKTAADHNGTTSQVIRRDFYVPVVFSSAGHFQGPTRQTGYVNVLTSLTCK